jgi:hypothetical protein
MSNTNAKPSRIIEADVRAAGPSDPSDPRLSESRIRTSFGLMDTSPWAVLHQGRARTLHPAQLFQAKLVADQE